MFASGTRRAIQPRLRTAHRGPNRNLTGKPLVTLGHFMDIPGAYELRATGLIMTLNRIFMAALAAILMVVAGESVADERRFGAFVVSSDRPGVIRLTGPIGVRDSLQFRRALRAVPEAQTLLLDSEGGSLIIALDLAEDVLERGLTTEVAEGSRCLSACALVFFAGRERVVKGRLGVHQVASTSSGNVGFTQSTLSDVLDLFRRAGVDLEIAQIMLATPADQMHVFNAEEIERLAINQAGGSSGHSASPPDSGAGAPVEARLSAEAREAIRLCDELAAYPADRNRPAGIVGVSFDDLNADRAVPACRSAAAVQPDSPRLQFQLGRSLDKLKRYDEAFYWYEKALAANYAPAQSNIGYMYQYGLGVTKDPIEAIKHYRSAAERGYAPAQFNLAEIYAEGEGVPRDDAEAFRLYGLAAAQGDADGQRKLGWMYDHGLGTAEDDAAAVRLYRQAADQGDASAQRLLGWMYANGRGVERNDGEALKWYRKAADQNEPAAVRLIGWMHENGYGVAKSATEAVAWYRKAADLGDADAQREVGWAYANGTGVSKNEAEAVRWYRKAADQNDAAAERLLGWMYANGLGLRKNETEAVKWYRKAAEKNEAAAQRLLGWMYATGRGIREDDAEAIKWYRKAAEQDEPQALYNLGAMYQSGQGVRKDLAEAARWYSRAAAVGHEDARKALQRLKKS